MSVKKIYTCDVCKDKIEDPVKSFGLHFRGMKTFSLGGYGCTEGAHICYGCAKQLYYHLNDETIKELLGLEGNEI